jgi:uncharacterized protein YyaL (SSP411 family)
MLYDQAMLAMAYAETHQVTGKVGYRKVAQEILSYVLRDMTAPEGGFYSAEDADSEGVEGKYYLWTEEEIRHVLGEEDTLVIRVFGIEKEGNFREEATGKRNGMNILHGRRPLTDVAFDLGRTEETLGEAVEMAREKLLKARETRIHPQKDDKILTDWNGLMIAALAKAAQAFDDPDYTRSAQGAADFFLQHLRKRDRRLLHRYRDGEAGIDATLNDYAFFIWGLIELYEATFQIKYLQTAIELNNDLLERFWDNEEGGFYFSPADGEKLLIRHKEAYDGAIPSGNSVAMLNLLRLGRMSADPKLEDYAARLARAFSGTLEQAPGAHASLLVALDFAIGPSYEVIVAGSLQAQDTKEMLQSLRSRFLPNKVVLLVPSPGEDEIAKIAPYAKGISAIEGQATAYVCSHYRCNAPTTDINTMLKLLHSKPGSL